MEVFTPTIPNNPQILSRISFFSPNSPFTTWKTKNQSKFTKKIKISAHFSKLNNRRNSLRQKLIQQQKQVPQTPILKDFQNPFHILDNNTSSSSKLESLVDFDNVVENIDIGVKDSKLKSLVDNVRESELGNSVLLNQLESWVDQYKEDTEIWGVGSGSIFTVFQDSEGNVERVDVNEDEILRRSEIEPQLYKKSEVEGLGEVKSKISHARFLAKEAGVGNCLIPKNSSVAKFVVSEDKLGFVSATNDQYKADSEFWGVGSGFIFTIFQDSEGKVKRVVVDEDEILRRSGIEPSLYDKSDVEVNSKISHARFLAREAEVGNCLIPKNSSAAKFVVSTEKSGVVSAINGFTLQRGLVSRYSRVGIAVLCGLFVFWGLKRFFSGSENEEDEYSNLEKEMMRRKMKARMEREKLVEGSVEVTENSKAPQIASIEWPKIDKENLMDTIFKAQVSNDQMTLQASSSGQDIKSTEFDNKIKEIREMARHARELEKKDASPDDSDEDDDQTIDTVPFKKEDINSSKIGGVIGNNNFTSLDDSMSGDSRFDSEVAKVENNDMQVEVTNDNESKTLELSSKIPQTRLPEFKKNSEKAKPRVIRSVKEAREYLSQKRDKQEPKVGTFREGDTILSGHGEKGSEGNISQGFPTKNIGPESVEILNLPYEDDKKSNPSTLVEKSDSTSAENASKDFIFKAKMDQITMDSLDLGSNGRLPEAPMPNVVKENWMEKNFHEFDPIIKKIGVGFQDNYKVAKEKINQEVNLDTEMIRPNIDEDEDELDWMKDDKLREIVFQVRENELLGRDPFYLMDAEDKVAFFEGLEKKVEKQNEKLQNLHQWVHSNVENLDYGADGISVHDPPEKIIPRWKGPPVNSSPEFLDDYLEQRKALVTKNSRAHEISPKTPGGSIEETKPQGNDLEMSKIVIEGSDGSVRAGKKSGKEFWQHTKKWSRGFLESYNAESDPEIKEVMKDMGKDLDRWITEKEVEEAAEIMNKLPEKGRKFIDEKLSRVKREMELYGPQAVMSKYSEYAEEKEEDYLWWLDLPVVLCIELYTNQEGDQNIGFYSLEMAADLELEPKPHHVIAFENAGDCKNLCYIMQAHMEMLGNGNAFVVALPPKDCFREAKANGFNVTVLRKGELKLNVDQTLEEVEEQITEIGSKMYHDKITKGRSVDIRALMKGVFGVKKPTKRKRSRRKLKKPNKR